MVYRVNVPDSSGNGLHMFSLINDSTKFKQNHTHYSKTTTTVTVLQPFFHNNPGEQVV